ncbi:hypothetical protein SLEP1_g26910 [Rubroshorea leprosula]|uniref:Uncharacterized protein n=1 Tax=Rubroshorea leprosula TaxID=152421 RepID=A0AAV5JNQ8_9ROSI|nr:hypothetical protein SLEP1_g26910 [Rubroshorea leprosula]
MPSMCFHEAIVLYLANKLGKPIKVNSITLLDTSEKFARVCVEVDLTQQLPSTLDLDLEELPQSMVWWSMKNRFAIIEELMDEETDLIVANKEKAAVEGENMANSKDITIEMDITLPQIAETQKEANKQQMDFVPKMLPSIQNSLACFPMESPATIMLQVDNTLPMLKPAQDLGVNPTLLQVGQVSCFITFAYVQPYSIMKDLFWDQLHGIAQHIHGNWVVMGYFNDILTVDEASPKAVRGFVRRQRFRDRLSSCGLHSMEPLGCKYTWLRKQNGRVPLRERLDKALFNLMALDTLLDAKVINLSRLCSDHHLVLFCLDTPI